MKSFYMELDAFDVLTSKKIGLLQVQGSDLDFEKIIMIAPEKQRFYVNAQEINKLARLAEEALDL